MDRRYKRPLNSGLLPEDDYASTEQRSAGFGPNVLSLQTAKDSSADWPLASSPGEPDLLLAPPKVSVTSETDLEYFLRKRSTVAVRHASGDRVVACMEIVSLGNKLSRRAMRNFVDKVSELLDRDIHLLVLDLHPPGRLDPSGIHGAIWRN